VKRRSNRQEAFTLIELLVVIGILTLLAALTAVYFANFAPGDSGQRSADQMSGWLLIARQQARRDGVPTGVRFVMSGTTATGIQYIQQPDDVAQGVYVGQASAHVALINSSTDLRTLGIQAGDYLEIYGGGVLRRTAGPPTLVANSTTQYQLPLDTTGVSLPASPTTAPTGTLTNYRVILQPRVIDGEATLSFPQGTGIDFSATSWNNNQPLSNPPTRFDPNLNQTVYEILFAPSGAVIGANTTTGLIVLWARSMKQSNASDRFIGKPLLITVQTRTGFIAQHMVSPNTDPYEFARDGKSSGM